MFFSHFTLNNAVLALEIIVAFNVVLGNNTCIDFQGF